MQPVQRYPKYPLPRHVGVQVGSCGLGGDPASCSEILCWFDALAIRMDFVPVDSLAHRVHYTCIFFGQRSEIMKQVAFMFLGLLSNTVFAQESLRKPEPSFKGKIGRTAKESTPDFPKGIEAPKGAPNVLLILTDDVGFGASST